MLFTVNTCLQHVLFIFVTFGILFVKHSVLSQETDPECSRRLFAKNGTGVVASYNYPFQYWTNMDCEYTIWLPDNDKDICFTFHRFNMKGNESTEENSENALGDYLEFQADGKRYRYHRNGKIFDSSGVKDNWLTVWDDNFCWPVTGNEFILHMVSDTTGVGTGFYAMYELKAASTSSTPSGNVPCTDNQWTCFDGGCVDLEQVCDGQMTCNDGSDETYFHARCETGSILACDFNSDCGFIGISSNEGWMVQSESEDPDRGPSADHTRGNIHAGGSYARTDFYTGRTSHLMMYDDTSLPLDQESCLSFWYQMGDRYPGKLEVFYEQPNRLSSYPDVLDGVRPLWVRDGNYGPRWQHAEIFIAKETVTRNERIIFMATRSSDVTLQIAVDDISLIPGKCFGDDIGCNFEGGMCGWSIRKDSSDNVVTWERTRRTGSALGPDEDASRSTSGYYLMLYNPESSSFQTEDQLITEPIIINGRDTYELCLTMVYFSTGAYDPENRPRTITITVETLDGQKGDKYIVELIDATQSYWQKWIRTKVTMRDITEPFRISFRPEFFTFPVVLALDEIAVIQGSCHDITLDSCGPGKFRCNNGYCTQYYGNCNGYTYCSDRSDGKEDVCRLKCIEQCGYGKYCCSNGPCINSSQYCDGFNDCGDWIDENNCKTAVTCQSPMFWCPHNDDYYYYPERCIDESYVCDGTGDCVEDEDEANCDELNGLSSGATAGIVIGVLLGIIIIIAVIIGWVYLQKREKEALSTTTNSNARSVAYLAAHSETQNDGRSEGHNEGSTRGRTICQSEGHIRSEDRTGGCREGHTENRTDASAPEVDLENHTPPGYNKAVNNPDIYRRPETPKSKGTRNQSQSSHTQPSTEPEVLPPAYDRIESGAYIAQVETAQGPSDAIESGHPIPREAPPPYTPNESRFSAETSSTEDQNRSTGRKRRRKRKQKNQPLPTAPREETHQANGTTNDAFESENYSLSGNTEGYGCSEYTV